MKKLLWFLGGLFLFFILADVVVSGFSVVDYQWKCTRCLRESHVVEKRFYGITYSKSETLESPGYDLADITGTPCLHLYRKGGFGRETYDILGGEAIADGSFADGVLFRDRWQELEEAFNLYQRVPNKALMRETLEFTDTCLPSDATMATISEAQKEKSNYLLLLASSLHQSNSETDWKKALTDIKAMMAADEKTK